jgi:hypothetical protein
MTVFSSGLLSVEGLYSRDSCSGARPDAGKCLHLGMLILRMGKVFRFGEIFTVMPRRVDLPPILHVCSLNRTQSSAQTVQPGR